MDERRDPTGAPDSGVPVIAVSPLSPVQQAWSNYVTHATACEQCRSLDAGKCDDAERLWRAYQKTGNEACDRMADGGP